MKMLTLLKLIGFGAGFVAAFALGTVALNLLSAPSTGSVVGGAALLIGLIAGAAAFVHKVTEKRGLLALALLLSVSACQRIEPGYEGIKVHMVGSDRGVDAYPIVTGRVWYNPVTYNIYTFPTFLQRIVWTSEEGEGSRADDSFTFRSAEGYSFNVDVGFGFSFRAGRTPYLFERYRRTAREITDGPFRDIVREAFVEAGSQMGGLDILGAGVTNLNETVTELVRAELSDEIEVDYVHMVGQPRVDARVEASINAVIEATQRANEAEEAVRQSEAEAMQRIAEAEGTAEAMRIEALARAEAIEIEAEALRQFGDAILNMRAIEKWNGIMPQVVGGDGAVPFINIPRN